MKVLLWIYIIAISTNALEILRSFSIDYKNGTFIKDGKPFRYISGSMHYFRIPRELWEDRLMKARASGLNAIQIYIEWSFHEAQHREYNFSEQRDVFSFIKMAADLDFLVILRPGPFIDAERDMGGLPFWLLQKDPEMKLRSSDSRFFKYVDEWFGVLLPMLRPLLYENGGNIIMIQVENEYGSYAIQTRHSDTKYLVHMRDLIRKHLGAKVLLFATDGCSSEDVLNSKTSGVFSTVDFGSNDAPKICFDVQSLFESNGPKVNSEFYPGWLDHWGEPHSKVKTSNVANRLDEMLALGANVNIYMMHGGTSFGFTAGANSPPFQPTPTSYDYDAPISESGDLTEKYFAIKDIVKKYLPIPDNINTTANSPQGNYGKVYLSPVGDIFHEDLNPFTKVETSQKPLTFEALGHGHGLVLYETLIKDHFSSPALLKIDGLHDRGYIFVNGQFKGILSRIMDIYEMPLTIAPEEKLQIVVENQGRICFGPGINDLKGILKKVALNGRELMNWTMKPISFNSQGRIPRFRIRNQGAMTFFKGTFKVPCNEDTAKDTFLNLSGWTKGVAFVNGVNLGRFWPQRGPQQTLYVPGPWIKANCEENQLMIFEQEQAPLNREFFVELVSKHVIDGPTPFSR